MRTSVSKGPGFWRTLWLLLKAAQLRSLGRQRRQRELFRARTRNGGADFTGFGFAVVVLAMALLHLLTAWILCRALVEGERLEAERNGVTMVSATFLQDVQGSRLDLPTLKRSPQELDRVFGKRIAAEAQRIESETGRDAAAIRLELVQSIADPGSSRLAAEPTTGTVLRMLGADHRLPAMLGALVLAVWSLGLIFQGEGVELDIQRRRNPMWEWLFSHPVPPAAVFLGELLSPLAANPLYYSAPLFPAVLYGLVYGPLHGAVALFVVGIPVIVAAACMGKALEVAVMLRCTPRTRGAVLGIMSWLGYAGTIVLFVGASADLGRLLTAAAGPLWHLASLPWPYLGLFLGRLPDSSYSMTIGVLTCGAGAALTIAGSVTFSVWAAKRGLTGVTGRVRPTSLAQGPGGAGFGRWPLYRKELLWLARDRSAIVQIVLIPLSFAGTQLLQLSQLTGHAGLGWNHVCGAGILLGTFFLSYLGPRSLASEGAALWITLT